MYSLARFNLENDFRQCVLLNSYPSQTHALKEKLCKGNKTLLPKHKITKKISCGKRKKHLLRHANTLQKEGFQKKKKNQSSEVNENLHSDKSL